jgi:hypothetical protein
MSQFDLSILGSILVMFGLAAALLALVLLRTVQQAQPGTTTSTPVSLQSDESDQPEEGILIIQAGGRVSYINNRAREYFCVGEGLPSLEILSRKIKPSDTFFRLCTATGDQQVNLNGQAVQITSITIPYGDNKANLLTFLPIQTLLERNNGHADRDDRQPSRNAVNLLNEMGQEMAACLDLESAVKAILVNIEKLISSDYIEITLYDPDNRILNIYRLEFNAGGGQEVAVSTVEELGSRLFTGDLVENRTPMLLTDVDEIEPENNSTRSQFLPIRSFLGVPLLNAGDLIGTLEL